MDSRYSQRRLNATDLESELVELSVYQERPDMAERFKIDYAQLVQNQLIGYGRFGRVHQYECNGITVAVKDIALSAKEEPRRERLRREGTIHMELRHRNIITLFNTQLLQQHLLLVMEFAAGGSLSDVIENHFGLHEPSVVTDWAAQIAEGMSFLHDKDIVHRDLKSSNILVLESIGNSGLLGKTLKIADFGLACDGHDETKTMSEVGGTTSWMAPEVLEPPHRFSKASDVYSFGMVVWNLLTGKQPTKDAANIFQAENMLRLLPFFDGLLKKCCTTEHWKRPSFRNIVRDMLQWQEQHAVNTAPIALCNEEFGSVSVNFLASSLPTAPQQQQQQHQSASFGATSASVKLPVDCQDVALMQDGRSLLLASGQHGLIELNSTSGRELSRWRPQHSSDGVEAVSALLDGRAAVSHAKLVVLLRRSETIRSSSSRSSSTITPANAVAEAAGDAWTEDCRIQLPWRAGWLSTHVDLLATSEWVGYRLQLLSCSRRLRLSGTELRRGYWIRSLTVAARLVVTGGCYKQKLGSRGSWDQFSEFATSQVLDAHSLDADGGSDKILWRHVLSSRSSLQQQQDELWGVCADSGRGCLYAAVWSSGRSSGRVAALSLANGSELRRFALSFHSPTLFLLLPKRLSLCDFGAAEQQQQQGSSSSRSGGGRMLLLAALCTVRSGSASTGQQTTVTLHHSTNDELQYDYDDDDDSYDELQFS